MVNVKTLWNMLTSHKNYSSLVRYEQPSRKKLRRLKTIARMRTSREREGPCCIEHKHLFAAIHVKSKKKKSKKTKRKSLQKICREGLLATGHVSINVTWRTYLQVMGHLLASLQIFVLLVIRTLSHSRPAIDECWDKNETKIRCETTRRRRSRAGGKYCTPLVCLLTKFCDRLARAVSCVCPDY